MKSNKTSLRGGLAGAAIAMSIAVAFGAQAAAPLHAPDVRIMTAPGQAESLKSLRGQVLLVNFWATSCATCLAEMPELARMHERFAVRGLRSFAVAMSYDKPALVASYLERNPLPFPITLDIDGAAARGFGDFKATPATFLIDRNGRVVAQYVGSIDFPDLQRRLDRLLALPQK